MSDTFFLVVYGFGWLIAARLLTNAFYYNERKPKPYSSAACGLAIGGMWPPVLLVVGMVYAVQFFDTHKDKLRFRGSGRVSRALIGDPYFPDSVKLETEKQEEGDGSRLRDYQSRSGGHW